uniref:Uncharacterized protein n=1 Tax=Brassica campestris TaxID=3711 RepID=A0A3P5Y2R1_BRACM|nr:unnamed protein product [Brassica rapa]
MNPSSFPSKSTIGVEIAIKNQKDIALIVSKHLFSTKPNTLTPFSHQRR